MPGRRRRSGDRRGRRPRSRRRPRRGTRLYRSRRPGRLSCGKPAALLLRPRSSIHFVHLLPAPVCAPNSLSRDATPRDSTPGVCRRLFDRQCADGQRVLGRVNLFSAKPYERRKHNHSGSTSNARQLLLDDAKFHVELNRPHRVKHNGFISQAARVRKTAP